MKTLAVILVLAGIIVFAIGFVIGWEFPIVIVPRTSEGKFYIKDHQLCLGNRGVDITGRPLSDVCGEDVQVILGDE